MQNSNILINELYYIITNLLLIGYYGNCNSQKKIVNPTKKHKY